MSRCARALLPLALLTLTMPAQASPVVRVYAADGRELHVGSVVSEGTLADGVCVFPGDTGVRVIGLDEVDSAVSVSIDDTCRLVVTTIDGAGGRTTINYGGVRPKVDQTVGASVPAGIPDVRIDGARDLTADIMADAATTERADFRVVLDVHATVDTGVLYDPLYTDYTGVYYTVNHRKKTVSNLVMHAGYCSGSFFVGTVDTSGGTVKPPCWYKRTSNGTSRVSFRSGGTYATYAGVVPVDRRDMHVEMSLTYAGTQRLEVDGYCDYGGTLPPGYTWTCYRWWQAQP